MPDFLKDMEEYSKAYNNFIETRDRCCIYSGPEYNPGTDWIWNSDYQKQVHDSVREIVSLIGELLLSPEIPDGAKSNLYLVLDECNRIDTSANQVK